MASGPFDDLPAPLTQHERKVLADLEAGLGDIRVHRRPSLHSVLRVLAVVVPLAGMAIGVAVLAVATLTPPGAVAMTGAVCTVVAAAATVLLIHPH